MCSEKDPFLDWLIMIRSFLMVTDEIFPASSS